MRFIEVCFIERLQKGLEIQFKKIDKKKASGITIQNYVRHWLQVSSRCNFIMIHLINRSIFGQLSPIDVRYQYISPTDQMSGFVFLKNYILVLESICMSKKECFLLLAQL